MKYYRICSLCQEYFIIQNESNCSIVDINGKSLPEFEQLDNDDWIINDNNDFNGYGIVIDKYILTLYHVIKDSTNITVDDLSYRLLLTLDEYDIAILVRKSNNLFDFINYFNEFNEKGGNYSYKVMNVNQKTTSCNNKILNK